MPRFVYKPVGGEEKSWEFDPTKLMSPECIAVEKLTGMSYGNAIDAFFDRSMVAAHAFLFVLMKRDMPQLRPSDLTFAYGDYDLESTVEEMREQLDEYDKVPEESRDPQQVRAAEVLRKLVAEADPDPKDPPA